MFGLSRRGAVETVLRLIRKPLSSATSLQQANYRKNEPPPTDPLAGEKLIWENYKRKHKGAIPPEKTRLRCKRNAGRRQIVGNPCPLCKYDVDVNFQNVRLLEQFVCPHTGAILPATKTGVCRLQQKKLVEAIEKAWDHGLMPLTIPQDVILPKNCHPDLKPVLPTWNKIEVLDSQNKG